MQILHNEFVKDKEEQREECENSDNLMILLKVHATYYGQEKFNQ